MKIIGLTGGFGCGKTTAANLLAQYPNVRLFNCDNAAKEILASAGFRNQLERLFGESVIRADGSIDRQAIADRLFRDDQLRSWLERLLHPKVRRLMNQKADEALNEGTELFVVESAILFETGLNRRCDATVCVVCDPNEQRWRLRDRGFRDDDIDRRLASQWPMERKADLADHVIMNSTRAHLKRSVRELYHRLTANSD